jgi:hypothetical protein
MGHLDHTEPDDWLLMDRNFPSYRMRAERLHRGRHFVIRCSAASFGVARQMLQGEGPDSQVVTLTPCAGQRRLIESLGLPLTLTVRYVRVPLSTGEWEVLVTALFLTYPMCDRPQRQPPRKKASARTLLDFQRRRKKHCYKTKILLT